MTEFLQQSVNLQGHCMKASTTPAWTDIVLKNNKAFIFNLFSSQLHRAENLPTRGEKSESKRRLPIPASLVYFTSALKTLHSLLQREKLAAIEVDSHLAPWIINYLTGRLQNVRLSDCT